jgi:hypothetical protein
VQADEQSECPFRCACTLGLAEEMKRRGARAMVDAG